MTDTVPKVKSKEPVIGPPSAIDELRIDFTKLFGVIVASSSLVVLGMGCVMIYIAIATSATAFDKVVVLRVFQIAFGNFFGGVCVYLGTVLTWFGIRESIRLGAATQDRWKLTLNTSSPGVILMLGGIVLIGIAMFCKIDMTEKTIRDAQDSTAVFGVGTPPPNDEPEKPAQEEATPDPSSAGHHAK